MRLCIYAKQTGSPCDGTVYSRRIVCEVGEENTCLRNCSSECKFYEPLSENVIAAKSAEIMQLKQETLEKIVTEGNGKPKAVARSTATDTGGSKPVSSGCGGCGGGPATLHTASSGGNYVASSGGAYIS